MKRPHRRCASTPWFMHLCVPAAATLLFLTLLLTSINAGETWDGNGGDNDWTTNNNWTPNGEPPNDGTADIVMAGTNRLMPNVDIDWDIRSLVFSNTAGAFSITGSSGVSLGIGEGGIVNQDTQTQSVLLPINLNANQTWSASLGPLSIGSNVSGHLLIPRTLTITGSFNTQIAGGIAGFTSLVKNGAGTLTFSAAGTNTYRGGTTVNAGTLALNRPGAPNSAVPGNLIIGDGAGGALGDIVRLDSSDQISEAAGSTVTINSSGLFNISGFDETIQNLTLNGGTVSGGGTLTVNGLITTGAATSSNISTRLESPALTINGAGELMLSGSQSNSTPGSVVINGGTVLLNKTGTAVALGPNFIGTSVTVGDGVGTDTLRLMANRQIADFSDITVKSSGVLDLNGFLQTLGKATLEGGRISTGSGTLVLRDRLVALSSAQVASFSGTLRWEFQADAHITVEDGPQSDDLRFEGFVTGFKKNGTGQMRITGSNGIIPLVATPVQVEQGTLVLERSLPDTAIAGSMGINRGATVVLAADEQITNNSANSIFVGGTLDLAGFTETVNDVGMRFGGGEIITNGGALAMRNLSLHGATLNPSSGLITINGAISTQSQPFLLVDPPTALLAGNVSLTAPDRLFDVADGVVATDLEVSLALSGTNTLAKAGTGTMLLSGAASIYTGTTTISAGTLVLGKTAVDGAIPGDLVVNGGTVRSAADEQIAATGTITLNTGGVLDLTDFIETIGDLSLNGGMTTMSAGTLAVTGAITQSTTATSTITGRLDLAGGTRTITVNDVVAAPIDLDIPAQIVSGGIGKQGSGALRLVTNNTFAGGVSVMAGKLLAGHDNALGTGTLSLDGGTVEADGAARTIVNPVVVTALSTVAGSENLAFDGSFTTNLGASLVKTGSGDLSIAGPQSHAPGATLFANDGVVNFNSSATGATLNVNIGGAGALVRFNADQNLNVLVVNAGRVSVGDSILRANGLSIDIDAALELEIGGVNAGSEFSRVVVDANTMLAGTLEITLVDGFTPAAGNSFDVFDWGTLNGMFNTLQLPTLSEGLTWDTSQLYTSGALSVEAALPPGDYNQNGAVDAADYVVWRKTDGSQAGYDLWRTNFGRAGATSSASAIVPEPSTIVPSLIGALAVLRQLLVKGSLRGTATIAMIRNTACTVN